jgi:hypothetical protein
MLVAEAEFGSGHFTLSTAEESIRYRQSVTNLGRAC